MKISVVIPAHNCAKTIKGTLDSVFRQTISPSEILVLDDGSTDNTYSELSSYVPKITLLRQENKGAALSRNELCERASGDIIAFLDADDIWHPNYLEYQMNLIKDYPSAIAFFTGHMNFFGYGSYDWENNPFDYQNTIQEYNSVTFFKKYNESTGPFASMSYCCIQKKALVQVGKAPFNSNTVPAEDSYFFYLIAPLGSVVYATIPLVAYRITDDSISANHVKAFKKWVHAFELLTETYLGFQDKSLVKEFKLAFSSKRRQYAKLLMGIGSDSEARKELLRSLSYTITLSSLLKSLGLLFLTFVPKKFQPIWPQSYRLAGEGNTKASLRR